MAELRSFIFIDRLQPQNMSYLGTWIKGALPRADVAAQIIEVAPGLDIEGVTDVALKHAEVQAGVLVVERQFGYLEFHGETGAVKAAADAAAVIEKYVADNAGRQRALGSATAVLLEGRGRTLVGRLPIAGQLRSWHKEHGPPPRQ